MGNVRFHTLSQKNGRKKTLRARRRGGAVINYPKASPKQGKVELENRMRECKESRLSFHYLCSKWMQWKNDWASVAGEVGQGCS